MLSMYHLSSKWCLNNATKFLTLGEHNVVNLSITWCSLSPFKNSIGPSPSSLNKCLPKGFACCYCYCWHLGWWGAKNLHIKQNFDMFNDLSTPPLWKMTFIWTKMNSLVEKSQNVTNWFMITCNWLLLITNFLYFYN